MKNNLNNENHHIRYRVTNYYTYQHCDILDNKILYKDENIIAHHLTNYIELIPEQVTKIDIFFVHNEFGNGKKDLKLDIGLIPHPFKSYKIHEIPFQFSPVIKTLKWTPGEK